MSWLLCNEGLSPFIFQGFFTVFDFPLYTIFLLVVIIKEFKEFKKICL
jgi:hypothetical protein